MLVIWNLTKVDCIFCKIAKGELESVNVYEDNDVLAFLDINPVTKGHCLVIPKTHSKDIFDTNEETLKKIIIAAKNISEKIKNSLGADGIRISQSNGKEAGQAIFHFHLHIIPRYQNDGMAMSDITTAHPPKADMEELKKLALQLHSGQAEQIKT